MDSRIRWAACRREGAYKQGGRRKENERKDKGRGLHRKKKMKT